MKADGFEDRTIDFEFEEDTEVWGSCSLTWRNEHYVFGGGTKVSQRLYEVFVNNEI